MLRILCSFAVSFAIISPGALFAQQPPTPDPEKEYQWLQQFAGEWESESEASMGPDTPPLKGKGSMTSRMLGHFWVINEVKAKMMDTTVTGIQTIGYNAEKKKYVGTWVDSMMNYMWQYEGTLDEAGNKLTLDAEGPNYMSEGKMTKFRDAYEFKSPDLIVATSLMLTEDGEWVTFMTGTMRRKK